MHEHWSHLSRRRRQYSGLCRCMWWHDSCSYVLVFNQIKNSSRQIHDFSAALEVNGYE